MPLQRSSSLQYYYYYKIQFLQIFQWPHRTTVHFFRSNISQNFSNTILRMKSSGAAKQ